MTLVGPKGGQYCAPEHTNKYNTKTYMSVDCGRRIVLVECRLVTSVLFAPRAKDEETVGGQRRQGPSLDDARTAADSEEIGSSYSGAQPP